jgi:SRSO17 transposase
LPAIACAVCLANDQVLHHCLSASPWSVAALQKRRLELILQQLNGKAIMLVIDETGDRKKGNTTGWLSLTPGTLYPSQALHSVFYQTG